MAFVPGFYTFDPFDAPVYVESINPVSVVSHGVEVAYDEVVTADAGTFIIAAGTFDVFAVAA